MWVRIGVVLLVGVILTQDLIDLELALDLGGWHANAPLADLLGLALLPFALLLGRGPLLAPLAYGGFLAVCLLSALSSIDPWGSLHYFVRKPLFYYVVFAVGLAWMVRRSAPAFVFRVTVIFALFTASLSVGTSLLRIMAGDTLWFDQLAGITPNHKTLAVALSAWIPWLYLGRRDHGWARLAGLAIALCCAAVALSLSKTALITLAVGLLFVFPKARPWGSRLWVGLPILVVGYALSLSSPLLLQSKTMLDAARSRHSLNVRAWEMFRTDPVLGAGIGMNVEWEMVTFPHYRVNGVDAHGVVQKVGSETGALGLLSYGLFVAGSARALWRRWDRRLLGTGYTEVLTWGLLHLNLLLSTETFSPTQWVALGILWGTASRRDVA